MTRYIEIGAMTVGALALFTVSFVGFASMTGTPLEKIALIGPLFSNGTKAGSEALASGEPPPRPASRNDDEVLRAHRGVLASYVLPAPFSDGRLQGVVEEIKARQIALDGRQAELDARAAELDERGATLLEQLRTLERIRSELEEKKREVLLLRAEQKSDTRARSGERDQALRSTSGLFIEGPAEELVERLTQFQADEAAVILRALKKERAAELLNALPIDKWKDYQAAYTAAP